MKDMKPNMRPEMNELRGAGEVGNDSPHSVMKAGGEDGRRYEAKILIDRVVRDNDMSGYNHNATSSQPSNNGRENEMWAKKQDVKAVNMGTPNVDGTYRY
jgi:hypothetical protein